MVKTRHLLGSTALIAGSLLASAAFGQVPSGGDRSFDEIRVAQADTGGGAGDVGVGGTGDMGGAGAGGAGGAGDMGAGGGTGDMGGGGGMGGGMEGGGDLPQTGGDPLSLMALGLTLSGVGVALRRRARK